MDFDDLILSVTSRLTHQVDFAFEKNIGELANRARAKFLTTKEPAATIMKVSVDDDGDVMIGTDKGTWYVSDRSVTVVGWLTSAKALEESRALDELIQIVESLFAERHQFEPEEYDIRVFVWAGSLSEDAVSTLLSRSCGGALETLFGKGAPSQLASGHVSMNYRKDKFLDSLDFEASKEDVQLRYKREGRAKDFASYRDFVNVADLKGVVEDFRPFVETFLASSAFARRFRRAARD